MNYSNPRMNPHTDSGHENKEMLIKEIDKIASLGKRGAEFHEHLATELNRHGGLRGYAWLHRPEAMEDHKWLSKLKKITMDRLKHHAKIDRSHMTEVDGYLISNTQDFKASFPKWIGYEKELAEAISKAIELSRNIDLQIYSCLIEKGDELHEEIMRARNVYDNLEFAGWNPHHVVVVSKWIHEQRESNPGSLDINIRIR